MAEPWIRVHANLDGRPLIGRAVEALGVSENEAIGTLVRFWGKVSQHAVNGDVSNIPDIQLEAWAGWKRKRGKFAAFIRSTHLDPDGRVREWDEYAGALETRRASDRRRKEAERERKSRGSHAEVTVTSVPARANETTTIRNETRKTVVVGEIAGVVIGETADYALQITIAANRAIGAKWGEQAHPLLHAQSYTLTDALEAAQVPLPLAKESIALQCERSLKASPPKSINWFREGILQHAQEVTQRQQDGPAEPADPFGLKAWAAKADQEAANG